MSTSTWLGGIQIPPAHPGLRSNIATEVAIIGGGLAGTFSGYLLGKAGKKVVILEKKDTSNSTTAYTTAWLNCAIDTNLCDLAEMYGEDDVKSIWRSGMEAIDLIEKIIEEEKIVCDFSRVSNFMYATREKEMGNLRKEHECAKKLGLETILNEKNVLNFKNEGSLELKSQAKFHPLKFLLGLRKASQKYGVIYYENTEVEDLQDMKGNGKDKSVIIKTKEGSVRATHSIIATYQPFKNPKELFAHKGTYLSYVLEANIPKNILKEGLYADEENPYHYFRIDAFVEFDRIILGGEDHRKELPIPAEKNYRALVSYLTELLPGVKYTLIRKWRGEIIETIDGLPYIGSYSQANPNKLITTGFSGNGMTYSAISGVILRDIILKNENPYTEIYRAGRKTKLFNFYKKAVDFTGEFFGGAVKNIFTK